MDVCHSKSNGSGFKLELQFIVPIVEVSSYWFTFSGNTFRANGAALPVGTPMFSYRDKENPYQYSDLLSRMQMQLGIRYSF